MRQLTLSLITVCLLVACTPAPKPINYGSDKCDFCMMTIVDPRFGAEVVTDKGKVFKFDAIECMVNYVQEQPSQAFAYLLVNDFEKPSVLVDAENSHYLISEQVPSPMGAHLSAYQEAATAESVKTEKGGQVYSWKELQEHFRTKAGSAN